MTDKPATADGPPALPPDDLARELVITSADNPEATHLAVVGDTYTILLTGADTGGRFAVIDMLVPAGSGPPLHRHDFEETFQVIDGELRVTFRDRTYTMTAGEMVNIPSNAPHHFHNASASTVRLLCVVAPAGLEDFFAAVGDQVATRTSPAPELSDDEKRVRMQKSIQLAPKYHQEVLVPE